MCHSQLNTIGFPPLPPTLPGRPMETSAELEPPLRMLLSSSSLTSSSLATLLVLPPLLKGTPLTEGRRVPLSEGSALAEFTLADKKIANILTADFV